MKTVKEPLRDVLGRILYEEGDERNDWYSLSEERREPWRLDADRVLNGLSDHLTPASPGAWTDTLNILPWLQNIEGPLLEIADDDNWDADAWCGPASTLNDICEFANTTLRDASETEA